MLTGTYKKTNNATATYGENSSSVMDLQKSLIAKGANIVADGKYGDLTKNAVSQYGGGSTVTPITPASGYADSTTKAGDYATGSSFVDKRLMTNPEGAKFDVNTGQPIVDNNKVAPKEPAVPKLGTVTDEDKTKIDDWGAKQKQDAQNLYNSSLSLINSNYASKASQIGVTYSKRIDDLTKLNKLQLDRTKAYGMSTAQYMPIEYTDAITTREKTDMDEIQKLNNERDSLLAEAERARDEGKVNALAGNQKSVAEIEALMEKRVSTALQNVQAQNQLAKDAYTAEKLKFTEDMHKMAQRAIGLYGDDYNKATTKAQKDAIIKKALDQVGDPANLDQVANLQNEFVKNFNTQLDTSLKQENTKSLISSRLETANKNKELSNTEITKNKTNDIADSILTLKAIMKKNNWKGVNPDQYNQISSLIRKDYGANAVLELDKEMKTANLRVDNGTKK